MTDINIDTLINSINETPSEYEERYFRWVSIGYDKPTLVKMLYELKYLREQEVQDEKKIALFEKILNEQDLNFLQNLLSNDFHASRMAMIEKYSRIAAMEILIENKYSTETLNIITQFPLGDYQLVVMRTQELVSLINDISNQASDLAAGVPGL